MGAHRFRTAFAVLAAVVLLGGCDWAQIGFGPARAGYNRFESHLSAGNVASLREAWHYAQDGYLVDPIVSGGRVFAGGEVDGANGFVALDLATGQRLWAATPAVRNPRPFAVAGGLLYVRSLDGIDVYDATGHDGCSGTPAMCSPLWSLPMSGTPVDAVVSGDVLYVIGAGLRAYDRKGVNGCSGNPRVCTPLWSATTQPATSLAVANGRVYVGTAPVSTPVVMQTFDARGVEGCNATTKQCAALWSAVDGSTGIREAFVSVSGGHAFVTVDTRLLAFDGAGIDGCNATLHLCAAAWRATLVDDARAPAAAAYGSVFVHDGAHIEAFDAEGVQACAGTPATCIPMWTGAVGGGAPSVVAANGLVFTNSGWLVAFDGEGTGCSRGTTPSCDPIAEYPLGGTLGSPIVSSGHVLFGTTNGVLALTV